MRHLLLLGLTTLILSSCASRHLFIQTQYVTEEILASYYVETPDPQLEDPPIGQRLLVQWSLPKSYGNYRDLTLRLTVRFYDRTEEVINIPIRKQRDSYYYSVINEKYCKTKGILTYKAELLGGGCVLETFRHQLWKELITFQTSSTNVNGR